MTSTELGAAPASATPASAARPPAGPTDPLGADLTGLLRALKLSGMKDTLPERLSLARTRQMGHAAFLELLLSDEVSRRDARSATLRAGHAGLMPLMRLDTWNEHENLTYDRGLLSDLTSLRFTEAGHNVLTRTGRGRKDTPGNSFGPHRDPPPADRADGPRRETVHPATGRPAGQHPGRRVPATDPPGPVDHRRLRHPTP